MGIDTSKIFLEGTRFSTTNSEYSAPPDNLPFQLGSTTTTTEYSCFVLGGIDGGVDIGDENLRIAYTKNDRIVRFGYDAGSRKWLPLPGSVPKNLGVITNNPRMNVGVPSTLNANFRVCVGLPSIFQFNITLVENDASFSKNLGSGLLEISKSSGNANFSFIDINNPLFLSQSVYVFRQSFFDRKTCDGYVGAASATLYLNPIPHGDEEPLIRFGYGPHISAFTVDNDSDIYTPGVNQIIISKSSGLCKFNDADVGKQVYYDGVYSGRSSLTRNYVGKVNSVGREQGIFNPFKNISDTDKSRYVVFTDGEERNYFDIEYDSGSPVYIKGDSVYVDTDDGTIYMSLADSASVGGDSLYVLDTYALIDGTSFLKLNRSFVNTTDVPTVHDFKSSYSYVDALIISNLSTSPFVLLPFTPIDNGVSISIDQGVGSSSTFVGPLNDWRNTDSSGLCFYVDFKSRQIRFANHKTFTKTFPNPQSSYVLPDKVLIPKSYQVRVNDEPLDESGMHVLDPNTGRLDFYKSCGETLSVSPTRISGRVEDNILYSFSDVFKTSDTGRSLILINGGDVSIRTIGAVRNSKIAQIIGSYEDVELLEFDIRNSVEYLVSNTWGEIKSSHTNFHVYYENGFGGERSEIDQSNYTVDSNVLVLASPPSPGTAVFVEYVSYTPSTGIIDYTPKSQYLTFLIPRETATNDVSNQKISFNPSGRAVDYTSGITITKNSLGVLSDKYVINHDNTIRLLDQFVESDIFRISYSVYEAYGNSRSFRLSSDFIYVNSPAAESGSSSIIFNGNQTSLIKRDGMLQVSESVYRVDSVLYLSDVDSTSVSISTSFSESSSGPFYGSSPVDFGQEVIGPQSISSGTSTVYLFGNYDVSNGSILNVDDDYYIVISASYNPETDATSLLLKKPLTSDYINPTMKLSDTAVVANQTNFNTKNALVKKYPYNLYLVGLNENSGKKLTETDDFSINEGGSITLKTGLTFGQSLAISYVAQQYLGANTTLSVNYAHFIAPDEVNGLVNQKLLASFQINSPDNYYFRIVPFLSYLPELSSDMSSGVTTSSGPSVSVPSANQNKDNGFPTPYFDTRRLANLDSATATILKYYHETAGLYENVLTYLDGRVIGGRDGKFQFNGNQGQIVTSLSDSANHIDDVYDGGDKWDWNEFKYIRDYQPLYKTNEHSRMYRTRLRTNFQINQNVGSDNNGLTLSNLGYRGISKTDRYSSAKGTSRYVVRNGIVVLISEENPAQILNPQYRAGMVVNIHDNAGTYVKTTTVLSVNYSVTPNTIVLSNSDIPVSGGIVTNTSVEWDGNHSYGDFDLDVDFSSGEVRNMTSEFLKVLIDQQEITASEILTTVLSYNNDSQSPKKIPALFGQTNTDDGLMSVPPYHRRCLIDVIEDEINLLNDHSWYGIGVILPNSPNQIVCTQSPSVYVGRLFYFNSGANSGISFSIVDVTDNVVTVNRDLIADNVNEYFYDTSVKTYHLSLLQEYNYIINDSVATGNGITDPVDSINKSLNSVVESCGNLTIESYGATSLPRIVTDNHQVLPDLKGQILFIRSGVNRGVYKVESNTSNEIKVVLNSDFGGFSDSSNVSYDVYARYSFWTDSGSSTVNQLMKFLSGFENSNQSFLSPYSMSNFEFRKEYLLSVKNQVISSVIPSITNVLESADSIYDRRYLWIKQRTHKKDGYLYRMEGARKNQTDTLEKMVEAAQKKAAIQGIT